MPRASTRAFVSAANCLVVYGPAGLLGLADAPVVEREHAVAGGHEVGRLVAPGLLLVGQAVDHHDGLGAVAFQQVVDLDAVDLDRGHGLPPLYAAAWVGVGNGVDGCQAGVLAGAGDVAGGAMAGPERRQGRASRRGRRRWRAGQRGWNRQPRGRVDGAGDLAPDGRVGQAAGGVGVRDRRHQALRVGVLGVARTAPMIGPSSATWPRYSTIARSQTCSTTARLCVMSTIAMPRSRLQLREQVEDLRLHRHVQGRDGLVGHDQLRAEGEGCGDADPLALPARQLMRVAGRRMRLPRPTWSSSSVHARRRAPRACPTA